MNTEAMGAMLQSTSASNEPALLPELLFVDADEVATRYLPLLSRTQSVASVSTARAAMQHLTQRSPAVIITELDLVDGSGIDVCVRGKSLRVPATVLVTTTAAESVPDALLAGCDAVLLKPFAPNLLHARVARLLRMRAVALQLGRLVRSDDPRQPAGPVVTGTNSVSPHTSCPYCRHQGVTSFEFASYRRAWFACLACRRVWIARRLE